MCRCLRRVLYRHYDRLAGHAGALLDFIQVVFTQLVPQFMQPAYRILPLGGGGHVQGSQFSEGEVRQGAEVGDVLDKISDERGQAFIVPGPIRQHRLQIIKSFLLE